MVEVAWKGRTRRVYFPYPPEMRHLTSKTKAAFANQVRLDTTEKRLLLLQQRQDLFVAEAEWLQEVAETSRYYSAVGAHFDGIKSLMYALVVLLNLNVLMR